MPSQAQAVSFRIEPPKIRLIIPPSGSQAGTIAVYNQSAEDFKIKAYLSDWVYTNTQDGTKEFFAPNTTTLSCAEWISFNPAEFIVPAFGRKIVNYVVRIPEQATGGHYAVMFFETSLLADDFETINSRMMQAGAFINVRIGALFYVEPKNTVKRIVRLDNFSVSKDAKNKHFFISADLKNIGNVDIAAEGTFNIIDRQGIVYARGDFNPVYTFPNDNARLSATWKDSIPQGAYDLILTLNLGKSLEEAGLGRGPVITKETQISIGSDGRVLSFGRLE